MIATALYEGATPPILSLGSSGCQYVDALHGKAAIKEMNFHFCQKSS